MRAETGVRAVLIVLGAAVMAYAAWLLLDRQTFAQSLEVGRWAIIAVVLHDAVLAPIALGIGWLLGRLGGAGGSNGAVAGGVRAAAVAGIVIATLGVTGFAVLTRSGDDAGNPTLLDRDYPLGLLGVAAVVVVVAAVAALAGAAGARLGARRP